MTKTEIAARLQNIKAELESAFPASAPVSLNAYAALKGEYVYEGKTYTVWTKALQRALDENSVVRVEPSEETYFIDSPVIIPSNRRILARGAKLSLVPGMRALMLKNASVVDGSLRPEDKTVPPDTNISVCGGIWGESNTERKGYGRTGAFDSEDSLPGVSTLMLFSNVTGLTISGLEYANTAGFSLQIGNAKRVAVCDIHFDRCYADGVHLNGNIEDVLVRNISGYVGDDLVAVNAYDWDNSGINFGPAKTLLIDGVRSDPDNPYKAIRIQPGVYLYPEGGESDCRIDDLYMRGVSGIKSYKLYLQTPCYVGQPEHPARVGRCGNIYFEDLDIDLDGQIDAGLYEMVRRSPSYNIFGAFEILADIDSAEFENIRLTLHKEELPESCLVSVGPKSMTFDGVNEVFDPYASCRVKKIRFKNISVNGAPAQSRDELLRVIKMKFNPLFPAVLPRGGEGAGEVDEAVFE